MSIERLNMGLDDSRVFNAGKDRKKPFFVNYTTRCGSGPYDFEEHYEFFATVHEAEKRFQELKEKALKFKNSC